MIIFFCSAAGNAPVNEVEEEFAALFDTFGVGVQMTRFLGGYEFTVIGSEAQWAVRLPFHLEKCIRAPKMSKVKHIVGHSRSM